MQIYITMTDNSNWDPVRWGPVAVHRSRAIITNIGVLDDELLARILSGGSSD